MLRASLLADRAESQVVAAKRRVAVQIDAIAWLWWFGDDAVEAKALLRKFEIALAKHLSERERLRAQFALLNGTEAMPRHEFRAYSFARNVKRSTRTDLGAAHG